MKHIHILRLERTAGATLGALLVDGRLLCWTLEPPVNGNQPRKSCIPCGRYTCEPSASPRFGRVVAVRGVPGREKIMFHAGNTAKDTEGCILLGSHPGILDGERAILGSAESTRAFLESMNGDSDIELVIESFQSGVA